MNTIDLTIESLAKLYRTREASPVEVTKNLLEEIRQQDGKLHAYATVTAELALEQAQTAEKEFKDGVDRGPLQGVPINLKDNIMTAGIPTEVGSPIMRGHVPTHDADVVKRLKRAGSVLLGKANMMEFAYAEVNPAFPLTNNPWNVEHTVSGSSSGSGASVAAGLSFGSLGTDTGGSVRMPSCYCGLVGLKPTYGLVSLDGVVPLAWSLDHVGPMTRSVYDNAALLSAISDFQFEPDFQSNVSVSGLRIGFLAMGDEVTEEVRSAIEKIGTHLQDRGATLVRDVEIPALDDAWKVFMGVLLPEASAAHDELIGEQAHQYHPLIRDRLEVGSLISAVDYIRAQRYRKQFCGEVYAAIDDLDALILPATLAPAFRHDTPPDPEAIVRLTRFTAPFNVIGSPTLAMPTGMSRSGLPLGMQIVGKPLAESVVYQIASVCEEVTECKGQIAKVFQ